MGRNEHPSLFMDSSKSAPISERTKVTLSGDKTPLTSPFTAFNGPKLAATIGDRFSLHSEVMPLKKGILAFLICMLVAGCSKSPGSQETGFQGLAWGSNAETVAKHFGVSSKLTPTDSMFGSYYEVSAPRVASLLNEGFSQLVTGKSDNDVDKTATVKHMAMLDGGKDGYNLFFNDKFGMNLNVIKASDFQAEHNALMKRYGVIDKKRDYIANEYESSYFIEWHDKDGVILLAREISKGQSHKLVTTAQIIHMDKKIFDAISNEMQNQGK